MNNTKVGLRDDRLDSLYATDEELAAGLNTKINTQTFTNQVNTLNTSIATKADQGAVDSAMALKANQSDVRAFVLFFHLTNNFVSIFEKLRR